MKDKLYRSRIHRVFGGVAGGLAEYLNLDPILVRIIFIIIALVNGFGIFLYIILWIVIQDQPIEFPASSSESQKQSAAPENSTGESAGQTDGLKTDDKPFDPAEFYKQYHAKKSNKGRIFAGVILIGIGFIFLAERYFSYFVLKDFFPLLLVLVGVILLWNSSRNKPGEL